ncbi:MAG TPA: hypothetical protein VEI57_14175 [Nitrospirota bacterium]|nr:hypothetical protein [Nitrospirota bacterium]
MQQLHGLRSSGEAPAWPVQADSGSYQAVRAKKQPRSDERSHKYKRGRAFTDARIPIRQVPLMSNVSAGTISRVMREACGGLLRASIATVTTAWFSTSITNAVRHREGKMLS